MINGECNHCGAKFMPGYRYGYECSICKKNFCDDHCCNATYVKHFKGIGFFELDKILEYGNFLRDYPLKNRTSYVCEKCFFEKGPADHALAKNIFRKVCSIEGCRNSLGIKTLNSKNACASCGFVACGSHNVPKKMMDPRWLSQHVAFPSAVSICQKCLSFKSIGESDDEELTHPKAPSLRLVAGKSGGKRNAIIVHGIMSNPQSMSFFAAGIFQNGLADSVWVFDDVGYVGRVSESLRIAPTELLELLNVKRAAIKTLAKVLGAKALKTFDLPEYIVEGAGRNLAQIIKSLELEDTILFGHSLGGLVVRCAAEAHDLSPYVRHIITLGSPFSMWSSVYSPREWDMVPNEKIQYLALLGKGDWVATHRITADLTPNDYKYKNVVKIVIPGHDHCSIHEDLSSGQGYEIIRTFILDELINEECEFYVKDTPRGESVLCCKKFHGEREDGTRCLTGGEGWIELSSFEK